MLYLLFFLLRDGEKLFRTIKYACSAALGLGSHSCKQSVDFGIRSQPASASSLLTPRLLPLSRDEP